MLDRGATRTGFTTALALTALLTLAGCVTAPDAASPPTAASKSAQPKPQRDETQTLWRLEGTTTTLPNDDPDIVAIQRTVALHSAAVDNRSPDTVTTTVDDEFSFYSDAFLSKLKAEKYRDAAIRLHRENGLTIEQLGVAWTTSTISEDRTRATVGFESILHFTSANEKYLQTRDLKLNQRYKQGRELTLVKTDNTWQISDIRKTSLNKPSSRNN